MEQVGTISVDTSHIPSAYVSSKTCKKVECSDGIVRHYITVRINMALGSEGTLEFSSLINRQRAGRLNDCGIGEVK